MLHAVVHSAGLQDRDGGVLVMATLFGMFPFLRKLYADAGYQGPKFQAALKRVLRQVLIEIVRRSDTARGFEVLPRRWVVERTIAWLNRCRRLAKGGCRAVPARRPVNDWVCPYAIPTAGRRSLRASAGRAAIMASSSRLRAA